MDQRRMAVGLMMVAVTVGCGDDAGAECPEDFPILRADGLCYAEADGAVADAGLEPDAAPGRDLGESPADAAPDDAGSGPVDGASCMGEHPLVEGARRFCPAGDCYCGSTDACYSSSTAEACCPEAVVCGPPADAGVCMGTHPLVDGDRRFCEPGDCYCPNPDSCFAASEAAGCCSADVVCDG